MALEQRLGATLRRLRIAAKLSQEELGEVADIHRNYIGAVERGEKRISVSALDKIVRALGLTLGQFFTQLEAEADAGGDTSL